MLNAIGIVKSLRPGDDVDAKCGKCKDIRSHAIVAVSPQGQVERVRCRTCQGEHNYRSPAKETKRASGSSSGSRATGSAKTPASQVVPTGPTKIYSPQQRFAVGDQISHPSFGIGLVVDVRDKKLDVKFGRETKILVHAG